MGHKLSYIGNVGAISQFNQIVERNVMCLRSVPFPKTFFCPKQLTYLNVGTCFFLVFPDKAINGGFSDLYMTTGQRILAAIPVTLYKQLAITNKHTNCP